MTRLALLLFTVLLATSCTGSLFKVKPVAELPPLPANTRSADAGGERGPGGGGVLHGAEPHLRAGSWETHELEYEADLLAAELLMPESWLEREIKRVEKEHHHLDIEDLARSFGVGRQEMEKRLRQLGLLRGEILGRM